MNLDDPAAPAAPGASGPPVPDDPAAGSPPIALRPLGFGDPLRWLGAGWRDFSIHMAGQAWFGALKQSAGKDWRKWAAGIEGEDVTRVKQFNKKLVEVIEYYRLYELDKQ